MKKSNLGSSLLRPGLLCLMLAGLLGPPAAAQNVLVGPLVEISRPNAVGSCNTGFTPFGLTWSTDHATEPFVAGICLA